MEQMDFNKTITLLKKFKLNFVDSEIVKSPEQALKIAKKFKFPVVLKIISKDILHKTDMGGVIINIKNEEELNLAYGKLAKKKKDIIVQKMEQGKEVIIGIKKDLQFGAVVVFGLGGIFVEVLKDVSLRIAPINRKEAEEMINEIKGIEILKGVRGEAPVKISALINMLVKVSNLAVKNKKITELDFNPIIVNEKYAKIVDVRIITNA